MDRSKELMCLNALEALFAMKYHSSEYCINGTKDSAVCIVNRDGVWMVFEKERLKEYDIKSFDTVVEACLDMIGRMVLDGTSTQVKNQFINAILTEDKDRITA